MENESVLQSDNILFDESNYITSPEQNFNYKAGLKVVGLGLATFLIFEFIIIVFYSHHPYASEFKYFLTDGAYLLILTLMFCIPILLIIAYFEIKERGQDQLIIGEREILLPGRTASQIFFNDHNVILGSDINKIYSYFDAGQRKILLYALVCNDTSIMRSGYLRLPEPFVENAIPLTSHDDAMEDLHIAMKSFTSINKLKCEVVNIS